MQITYKEYTPTPEEFNNLTEAVDWGTRENKIIEEALKHTLYSLCVYDENKLIGYGRIIGDKTIFLYIQDIMVIPEYQGKKIGTGIMNKLIEKINEYKKVNPEIRTYLGATKGKESFYEKFGFISRPNEDLGAGMVLYNQWCYLYLNSHLNITKSNFSFNSFTWTYFPWYITKKGELNEKSNIKKHTKETQIKRRR